MDCVQNLRVKSTECQSRPSKAFLPAESGNFDGIGPRFPTWPLPAFCSAGCAVEGKEFMPGVLYQYLSDDHVRMLDVLLERAVATPGTIDMQPYSEFRNRLLRHISIEEKIVIPAIAKWQGGKKAAIAERLRLDHGAIVSLLVPLPTPSIILTLRAIFEVHNPREEEAQADLYELFEKLAGLETQTMLDELMATPAVLVLPHNGKPDAIETTRKAVARAGYEFKTEP